MWLETEALFDDRETKAGNEMKTAGYAYVQTNDAKENEVVVYGRDDAGRLGRFLYALHADTGHVYGREVGGGGALAPVGSVNGLPLTAAGLAAS